MIGKLSARDKRELAKIQKSEKLIEKFYQASKNNKKSSVTLTEIRRSLMLTGHVIKKVLPEKYDYYMKCSKATFLKNKFCELKLMADLRYCFAFAKARLSINPKDINPDWD